MTWNPKALATNELGAPGPSFRVISQECDLGDLGALAGVPVGVRRRTNLQRREGGYRCSELPVTGREDPAEGSEAGTAAPAISRAVASRHTDSLEHLPDERRQQVQPERSLN